MNVQDILKIKLVAQWTITWQRKTENINEKEKIIINFYFTHSVACLLASAYVRLSLCVAECVFAHFADARRRHKPKTDIKWNQFFLYFYNLLNNFSCCVARRVPFFLACLLVILLLPLWLSPQRIRFLPTINFIWCILYGWKWWWHENAATAVVLPPSSSLSTFSHF